MSAEPSAGFYAALLREISEGVLVTDDVGTIRWASEAACRLLGRRYDDLVGVNTVDLQHPEDAELSRTRRAANQARPEAAMHSIRRAVLQDGSIRTLDCTSIDLQHVPEIGGIAVILRDGTERHQTWEAQRRLQALVEHAQDAVIVFGRDLRVAYASPSVHDLMDDLSGTVLEQIGRFVEPDEREETLETLSSCIDVPGSSVATTLLLTRTDGVANWVEIRATNLLDDPAVAGIVMNGRNVTERVEVENRLLAAARADPLTGLPNRTRIIEHLEAALADAADPSTVVVLFLDLDRFKVVNDSFGHGTGDRVLVELGERISAAVGDDGVVGRFGGDEFVVVAHAATPDLALGLADLLARTASLPFTVTGPDHELAEVYLSGSIGIALGSSHTEPATLLHHADAAMYRAKERGRGTWELYDEGMRRAALSRLTLEAELARALDDRGFELWYQPIVDVGTGRVKGFEALARWRHRERGLVSPAEFIPVAEETGGIHRLGAWALATACSQMRAWQALGVGDVTMSVNLSPRQLTRDELAGDITELLGDSGVDPALVCLEITETLLMDDLELAVKALSRLRDTGVHLALDDFGTGWSSLTYLRSVPVDEVKIDRSFINGVAETTDDHTIVGAVVTMCRALGKDVVAEGVETEAQYRALRELGCSFAQGYLFAKPLPAAEVPAWLDRYRTAGNRDPDRSH